MVRRRVLFSSALFFAIIIVSASGWSQKADQSVTPAEERLIRSITSLQAQVDQLNAELTKMRLSEDTLRAEIAELRNQSMPSVVSSQSTSGQGENDPPISYITPVTKSNSPGAENSNSDPPPLDERVEMLEKKVNEQYQTKVESGSKYRVGVSGLILLNLFANRGNVDSIEDPAVAEQIDPILRNRGSIGGTLRQTELGFEVNGPNVFGARTSGNLQFDFAGGLTPTPGGETMGVVRLRTGTMRLDWQNTSFVAGQDSLFFVPLSPTSYASVLQPPLAYAGQLWGWIPQARIEQRIGPSVTVQAGVLDPINDQFPDNSQNVRPPGPGEQTRMPGFGTHVGWSHAMFGQKVTFGGGGYYGRQQFQVSQVDNAPPSEVVSWLGSADWQVPLSHWLIVSGSLYRGSALGGLAGGLGTSVVFTNFKALAPGGNGNLPPDGLVKGLNTEGGWSQLKIQPFQKLEWNFAVGNDNPFAAQRNSSIVAPDYLEVPLLRNRAGFANVIYRPRSDLLLAWEFRHIESYPIGQNRVSANQANLGMGIMF